MARQKVKRKSKGRQRIYGFSWTHAGQTQALYENDFNTRKDFLRERESFRKNGIKIKDYKTISPYRRG